MYTLIPSSSNINACTWLVAIVFAIVAHLIFFIAYQKPKLSSEATGHTRTKSIQIGLKKIVNSSPPAKSKLLIQPPSSPKRKLRPLTTISKATISKTTISKTSSPKKTEASVKQKPIANPKPVIKKWVTESKTHEPVEEENIMEKSTIEESTIEKSTIEESSTAENVMKESAIEKSIVETDITQENIKETNATSYNEPSLTSRGKSNLKANYETRLAAWLTRYKRYPPIAKRRRQEDLIELEFTIDQQGNLLSQRIINTSPYNSLNRAVIKMITKASPLPPVPKGIRGGKTTFTFIIPILFELN